MALKITVSGADPKQLSVDVLAIGVTEGARRSGLYGDVVKAIDAARTVLSRAEFSGKRGQSCQLMSGGALKATYVLLIGMGSEVDGPALRRLTAQAAREASGLHAKSLAVLAPEAEGVSDAPRWLAEGVVFGAYRFERYKTGENVTKHTLDKASLLVDGKVNASLRDATDLGQRIAEGICRARDLINTPPNDLYPEAFAEYAKEMAKRYKGAGMSCTVFSHEQIKQKGMNLLEAVGRGSARGPRLIHLKYKPKGSAKNLKRLVFVGKGITFDSGGLCIKPAGGMEDMKGDMGGAANVIGLMAAVTEANVQAEVHGIIASAENMPDGAAYRPSDIFTAYSGKTVEIINTDAEGRLALADALAYAQELEPDLIVDNATLTGAVVVALGTTYSAYYSNREELAEAMKKSASRAGEALWHMPLVEELREKLKSDWADIKHTGDRWGGSITAALFLREFVNDIPWIHVDVAGPSTAEKSYDIYTKGGTGQAVLTYLALVEELISQ